MIRQATIDDVAEVVGLSRRFAGEIGMGEHHNVRSAAALVSEMTNNGILVVAERDKMIVGCMGGTISCSPWNPTYKVLEEQIYYLLPDYRQTTIGMRMFKTYDSLAKQTNTGMQTLKLMFNSPDLDKHYRKVGYVPLETTYVRRS